ncbi:MAG: SH3 domain-containing protein [Lachnospiraceae bacterium]|nr:SH3 domain-containing protein [Lachnospiraceae bacterium]
MLKDKFNAIRDYVMKNYNILLSVGIIFVVAVTVAFALGAASQRKAKDIRPEEESSSEVVVEDVPLVENEDSAIKELILTYYNAQALGDIDTIKSVCDEVSDLEVLSYQEKANYIEYYPKIEIYTKQGLYEGEWIVYVYYRLTFVNHEEEFPGYTSHYVCTAEDGSLYIKKTNFSDELNEYTSMICAQDDVVEFNNRVKAEYDTFKEEHPELAYYADEVMEQINMNVGVKWSQMQAEAAAQEQEGGDVSGADAVTQTDGNASDEPVYAFATTTVNVRSSDSEQADRIGKATGGSKVQVLEQKVNGWSKILLEGKEGYIKSEYLQLEESAAGQASIGTVKATTNINVRASASETASKLGVLAGGDTAELIAVEGDWCKIKYSGKVGYVKGEYVQKQ